MHESKRTMLDAIQATKIEANLHVKKLGDAMEKIVPAADGSLDLAQESVKKELQDILQPLPGKKVEGLSLAALPKLIEEKSGIKNIARDTWKYETKGEFRRLTTP